MAAFVTSDSHFGHTKMLTFLGPDGNRIRPFESLDEMHQVMIDNWNKTVHPKDTVYHQVIHKSKPDPLYFNTCVERNNFTPVSLDAIRQYFGL
jgi:calcineurin-like phosphoesterase family protein